MYIYHLLNANRYHLSPNIVEAILSNSKREHFFLLLGNENTDWDVYSNIFQSSTFVNYVFANSLSHLLLSVSKKSPILLHGDSYVWMFFLILKGYKNINWICWGSGTTLNKRLKSYLSYPIKFLIYHRLNSVVSLMEPDRLALIKYFRLNKVFTIPYYGKKNEEREHWIDWARQQNLKSDFPIIYLGNNSTCLDSYIDVMNNYLSHFSNKNISIQCMLHYDLNKNRKYNQLLEIGEKKFKYRFHLNTTLYSLDEYFQYMNKCDIYICGVERQTGLGAINSCLRLGKKMYLSGNNYNWVISWGAKVYHIEDLEDITFDDFVTPLTEDEKEYNNRIALKMSDNSNVELWEQYYDDIKF